MVEQRAAIPQMMFDTEHSGVPHGCLSGWVYVGHLVIEDDGDEVEVIEQMRCRRCALAEYHERF